MDAAFAVILGLKNAVNAAAVRALIPRWRSVARVNV